LPCGFAAADADDENARTAAERAAVATAASDSRRRARFLLVGMSMSSPDGDCLTVRCARVLCSAMAIGAEGYCSEKTTTVNEH
jgi:hypothetical protein